MATYPGAVKTFTTKSDGAGNKIFAAHINELQDEVTAIEDGLLNGSAPLSCSNASVNRLNAASASTLATLQAGASTLASLQVTGNSTFAGSLAANLSTITRLSVSSAMSVSGPSTFAQSVYLGSQFRVDNTVTPVALSTGDNHDYAISSAAFAVQLSGNSSGSSLTGITGPESGRFLLLINVGAAAIGLKHSTGSSAANRFALDNNADTSLPNNAAMLIWYDGVTQRWRQVR